MLYLTYPPAPPRVPRSIAYRIVQWLLILLLFALNGGDIWH